MSANDDDATMRCPLCQVTYDVHKYIRPDCPGEANDRAWEEFFAAAKAGDGA